MNKYLKSIYYNPKHPGSYSGPTKLLRVVRQEGKNYSLGQIKKWLSGQETYTLHRSVQHRIQRNKVVVDGIDDQWDMDLMDMGSLAKYNDGVHFVLLCIDIFSRYVWLYPLKSKQTKDVVAGLKVIFGEGRIPSKIRHDAGTEFTGKKTVQFLKDQGVISFVTHNEVKASYAERAIKTIKGKIFKFFSQMETYKYIDKLQDFAYSYNHTHHRSIQMAPVEVNASNEAALWHQQYVEPYLKTKKKKKTKFKFQVNDKVRVSFLREKFSREYHQKWSGEVFTITHRVMQKGLPFYKLKGYAGDSEDNF